MAGSHPATTRVGRGGSIGRTDAEPGPSGPKARPPAGRNPARLAEAPDSGRATNSSPIGASMTRAPLFPTGATGRAETGETGLPGPNSSSNVRPSARARASATRSDGSERPDSTAETACRDTPAMPASCCWENPRAWRASRSRIPPPEPPLAPRVEPPLSSVMSGSAPGPGARPGPAAGPADR